MTDLYPTGAAPSPAVGHHTVTPRELARELGHHDSGVAICNFIRFPDDGRGPFVASLRDPRKLTAEQADRIRDRFAF